MKREKLKSRLGFLLLSAGCDIGIGNVWKFPYMAGQGGGGAFVMCYLLFLAILLRAVDSLKLFDTAFVLTQGGPGNATEFLSLHVYRMANAQNGLIGRAAAIALVLLAITTVVSRILIKQQRKEDD